MTRVEPPFEAPVPDMTMLDAKEIVESGLLFEINRRVLWPLGLSLTMKREHRCAKHHKVTCDQSHAAKYGVEIIYLVGIRDHSEVVIPSGGASAFVKWSAERLRKLNP